MTEERWDGERATRWLRQAAGLERQLSPVSDLLFATAAVQPGEDVLDVGCGTGPTTRRAAELAGPGGRVTGLDVSADMIAAAAAAEPAPGSAPVDWVTADVVGWDPPRAAYDAVISRFGVMFFSDTVAALSTLAEATRAGGRLAVAVWARRGDSPLFEVPYQVALRTLGGASTVPDDQGPFAWHDPVRVAEQLTAAGWSDPVAHEHRLPLRFAGGVGPEQAAVAALDFGATRQLLADADEATNQAARAAIAEEFTRHLDDAGHVELDAVVRVVTARR